MSATAGTVALVNTTTPLVCKTAADCAADTRIIDLVGYGTAVVRETAPAPATSNTTSAARSSLTDTDNNAADFTAGTPSPQNSGDVPPPLPPLVRIHDIQGDGHLSSMAGTAVRASGVVTAVRAFGSARGFWMQDPEPDAVAATSEGIFVFTGSTTPAVQPGDAVTVTGTVTEFYPECLGDALHDRAHRRDVGHELDRQRGARGRTARPEHGARRLHARARRQHRALHTAAEPVRARLLRVTRGHARAASPTLVWWARRPTFNELFVTTKPNEHPTARGGTLYGGYDQQNSGRLLIQSLIPFAQRPFPRVNVGDSLTGVTAGPVDYSQFGGYMIQATELGTVTDGGIQRETTRRAASTTRSPSPPTTSRTSTPPTRLTSSLGWPKASSPT